MIPCNTILFATPDVDIAEIEAKEYIKQMQLTREDVIIIRTDGQILIRALRDIE